MRFPRFKSVAANKSGLVTARGWSDVSQAEADANANARLLRILAWLKSKRHQDLDRYSYVIDDVIIEEVLERVALQGGGEVVVTRNAYGAEILNTDRALFVDVDVPRPKPKRRGLFGLFGGKEPPPYDELIAAKLAEIERWQDEHPDVALRVYRTHSGLRVVVLNEPFAPDEPRGAAVLTGLCTDDLYRALCRRQRCARARLTPKPWRIGLKPPALVGAQANEHRRLEIDAWLREYERTREASAVCREVATFGQAAPHPVVARVLAIHDARCGVGSDKPLA